MGSSYAFKSALRRYGFNDYKFNILNTTHREETVQLLSHQFSSRGTNPDSLAFALDIKKGDVDISQIVDHAINTGLSLVVLDKYDKVCFVKIQENVVYDDEQEPEETDSNHKVSSNVQCLFQTLKDF